MNQIVKWLSPWQVSRLRRLLADNELPAIVCEYDDRGTWAHAIIDRAAFHGVRAEVETLVLDILDLADREGYAVALPVLPLGGRRV